MTEAKRRLCVHYAVLKKRTTPSPPHNPWPAQADGVCGPDVIAALGRLGGMTAGPVQLAGIREREYLERIPRRLADRRITLEVTDAAAALLAHEGYDPAFGARPLKRVIQREIGDRAAMLVLEGKVGEGDTIVVDAVDGAFDVHASEGAPALI